jgi:hypothetical protein
MFSFLQKYLKGNFFYNSGSASLAQFAGALLGGFLLSLLYSSNKGSLKIALMSVFSICLVGAVALWIVQAYSPAFTPAAVLLITLGNYAC